MDFVILDLEWNGSFSRRRKKYVNEIIDIGAVRLSGKLERVDSYSMLITPQIGKKLNKYVEELTHISIDELEQAQHTFTHALSKFNEFAHDSVILTWGTTDILTMMSNCEYYLHDSRPPFLKYYVDLQTYCQSFLPGSAPGKQMGLSAVAEILGIEYEADAMHRALADSELSARCFEKLFNPERLSDYIQTTDEEFYRRVTFKNHYITDLASPYLDKSELYGVCDACGERLKTDRKWVSRNRGLRVKAQCPKCRRKGYLTVRFKRTYDGVEVRRFFSPMEQDIVDGGAAGTSVLR